MLIVGIELHTDNSEIGLQKIGEHWNRFYQEQVLQLISYRKNNKIVALYTNYEKDHTGPYSLILGAEVNATKNVPQGMVSVQVPQQTYNIFTAKGAMPKALVATWQKIWNTDMQRTFVADFELYDERSNQGSASEVDIYIAVA